jgi:general stress protein 26
MDEDRTKAVELMKTADVAVLTTINGERFPETRAMFNLRCAKQFPELDSLFQGMEEVFITYFTTNTSSSKVAHIKKNPKVSVFYCNSRELKGLMVSGLMEIVMDREVKSRIWQKGWEIYYPSGVDDPDFTILRLKPLVVKYYHNLNWSVWDLRNRKYQKAPS